MPDPRVSKLAQILVQYSTEVQPGDLVAIVGMPPAKPLIAECFRETLRAGGHPYVFSTFDELEPIFFGEASEGQLQHVNRVLKMIYGEFDALISIYSQSNTRGLTHADPAKQSVRAKAHTDVFRLYMDRGATRELKWNVTMFPTDAYAQDAEMSLEEFENYVYSTTYADTEDPVGEWKKIQAEQQRLVDWFDGKKNMEVNGPDIDLSLSIDGRKFENADGRMNMPSGEIFTGPVEDSVNGWARFTYPAVTSGREIEGVELRFENGKVVAATAEKNEAYLHAVLDTDDGARYLGEFAIATNKKIDRFIKSILFDEKIGGTIHMAVGSGYPSTGSENVSAVHLDMICDMRQGGRIHVDGELIYESGEFKI